MSKSQSPEALHPSWTSTLHQLHRPWRQRRVQQTPNHTPLTYCPVCLLCPNKKRTERKWRTTGQREMRKWKVGGLVVRVLSEASLGVWLVQQVKVIFTLSPKVMFIVCSGVVKSWWKEADFKCSRFGFSSVQADVSNYLSIDPFLIYHFLSVYVWLHVCLEEETATGKHVCICTRFSMHACVSCLHTSFHHALAHFHGQEVFVSLLNGQRAICVVISLKTVLQPHQRTTCQWVD